MRLWRAKELESLKGCLLVENQYKISTRVESESVSWHLYLSALLTEVGLLASVNTLVDGQS